MKIKRDKTKIKCYSQDSVRILKVPFRSILIKAGNQNDSKNKEKDYEKETDCITDSRHHGRITPDGGLRLIRRSGSGSSG